MVSPYITPISSLTRLLHCKSASTFNKVANSVVHFYCSSISTPPLFHHEELRQCHLSSLLQSCSKAPHLYDYVTPLHALSIKVSSFLDQPIFIHNNFIRVYAELGELSSSQKVFDQMPERNVVSYNSIIAAYSKHGYRYVALELFYQMMDLGFKPTQFTFGSLLSASTSLDYIHGFQLHSLVLKSGLLYSDIYTGTALVNFFGEFGKLNDALKLFREMPRQNLVMWNSIITSHGKLGLVEESVALFLELLRVDFRPSEFSFAGILLGIELPAFLKVGEQIHGLVIKTGAGIYRSVANSVLNMYAKCSGTTCSGEKMFRDIPLLDVVSWNIIIGAFARSKTPLKAFVLFLVMSWHGFLPSETTFLSVISSCIRMERREYGEIIHAKVVKIGLISNTFVGSALVDFYAKCGNFVEADLVFADLHEKSVVSWNALIAGHSSKGSRHSVYLLVEMLREGYLPNEFSFSAVLKTSSDEELQQFHCLLLKMGYHRNDYVTSSLIASYGMNGMVFDALRFTTDLMQPLSSASANVISGIYNRTGQFQETKKLLSQFEETDIISWNILLDACARSGDYKELFNVFRNMQMVGVLPDKCTAMSLLSSSRNLYNLGLGSSIHGFLVKMDFKCCDVYVCNVLLDMYAKCGCLQSSVKIFNEMRDKNIVTWTCLISALGNHGYAVEALQRFIEMESKGFKPDRIAFITVLSACRHGGMVEEGLELFDRMWERYGIEPDIDHFICVVDMLSRYGHHIEAERLIVRMPFRPNALIWRVFLEGCQRYYQHNVEANAVGRQYAKVVFH